MVTDFRLHHTCSIIILWLHSLSGVIRNLLCNLRAFGPGIIIISACANKPTLKFIRVQLTPEVVCRRKIQRSTFLHTSKSHSAAPGIHAYIQRAGIARKNASALQLFTLHFLSWWSSQSYPNKLQ